MSICLLKTDRNYKTTDTHNIVNLLERFIDMDNPLVSIILLCLFILYSVCLYESSVYEWMQVMGSGFRAGFSIRFWLAVCIVQNRDGI